MNTTRSRNRRHLTALEVKALGPGLYSDNLNGLYLAVARPTDANPKGSRSWIVRYTSPATGARREMGLGNADVDKGGMELASARDKAAEIARELRAGVDPKEARDAAKVAAQVREEEQARASMTFGAYADKVLADIKRQFKNTKHQKQWEMTLRDYAKPLNDIPLADITQDDILVVFKQVPKSEAKRGGSRVLWAAVPETARRLRGRLEDILAHAKADGYRTGENPAALSKDLSVRLDRLNDSAKPSKGHFARLDHDKLPAFMTALRAREGTAARALELLILTAARSGEVRGAFWSEFDLDAAIPTWTMPAGRTKSAREHIVPLSRQAVELLRRTQPDFDQRQGLVFPGKAGSNGQNRPLSDMTLTAVLSRMAFAPWLAAMLNREPPKKSAKGELPSNKAKEKPRQGVTIHGFRSTFRDWAGDETEFAHETIEASLAHVISDKTVAAYRRNTAIKKRASLMAAWAEFCSTPSLPANVVPIAFAA
ncbi:integrase arm-type DNA-binding domain-containing protein [Mesorhizobium sp. BR1-1-12]|uniref:tyrosine-type recombinase/integrase n=1 Tax=unclassified Mesorhizobium TaxID=325217 RepID=UPI001CD02A90|nr:MULTISPECIES: site-specific integrase [unclassified Mesorhizobium]MBZ9917114.1 integrase arm-type DNA-binding domain-containing protein [Mesorhizobium sp. BR1-1-7]MBZ9968278.1 integrase arm-type DNA-binding domain-containing protein [Mesorhizobium sp. BR1-1-12]